jgi:ATP-dependent RNA helicase DOB1
MEEINPEYMLERSFFLFQNNSSIPSREKKVRELEAQRDGVYIENEDQVTNYYRIRQQLHRLENEMQAFITKPKYCVPFLQPGRLVRVEHGEEEDFGWGAVVNFQKKANQKMQSEAVYAVEVLLCCSTESCKGAPKAPPKPPPPGDKGEMQQPYTRELSTFHRLSLFFFLTSPN